MVERQDLISAKHSYSDKCRYLTVKQPETNQEIKIPVLEGNVIAATSLAKLKIPQTMPAPETPNDQVPLRFFDPGFKSKNIWHLTLGFVIDTAVCNTKISEIDGVNGKLYYRGYDIEELFENSSFIEVSYLLIYGELPSNVELENWNESIMKHTYLHSAIEKQMSTFRYDCHPMGQLIATIASLSTFTPDANPCIVDTAMYMHPKFSDPPTIEELERDEWVQQNRQKFIFRALGKVPTISAAVYRHRIGRHYNQPMPQSTNYCENLVYMMHKLNEHNYAPDKRIVKILDKLFILLAEHGVNCSTVMMRHLMSSGVDPYTALSGAAGALFGERKSSSVISMIKKIGSVDKIDEFLKSIKIPKSTSEQSLPSGSGKQLKKPRLMGFGHRIYKSGDPRVKLCKVLTEQLFDVLGCSKNAKIALALEEKVVNDPWFTSRNLYPNIDFWTGIIFDTLEFPPDMYPVWMFIPRVAGFIAHCIECLDDPEYKIFRPRQVYIGSKKRAYEPFRDGESEDPAIESQKKDALFRPSSSQAHKLDNREGLQTALEDFYTELDTIDFDSQFDGDPKESKLGWSLRSWVRKRFGVGSSPFAQTLIDNMQAEMKELRFDSKKEKCESEDRLAGSGPNLMAGSSHLRVIAPSNSSPTSKQR